MHMEIITEEQAAKMPLLPFGKKHPARVFIEKLQPGQLLRISRADFNWKKRTPNFFCRQLHKAGKGKFEVMKEIGNTGWVVRRVE